MMHRSIDQISHYSHLFLPPPLKWDHFAYVIIAVLIRESLLIHVCICPVQRGYRTDHLRCSLFVCLLHKCHCLPVEERRITNQQWQKVSPFIYVCSTLLAPGGSGVEIAAYLIEPAPVTSRGRKERESGYLTSPEHFKLRLDGGFFPGINRCEIRERRRRSPETTNCE